MVVAIGASFRGNIKLSGYYLDHNAETGGIAGAADVATLQAEASQR